ncbi:MAG: KpsF/GutQ family sugar-phosphate isomerase [Candidatus Riflebacteria bacterium]|nr:KpsF/GutQ family sugar-phosphate isomerase [Candidatus Riflebacteria bacterium]
MTTIARAAASPVAGEEYLSRARSVLDTEAQAILDLKRQLGSDFVRAVRCMAKTRGRVVVTGMGKSGIIAKKMAATLASTGTPALFLHAAEAAHGDLGMILPGDVVIALSNSGETDEVLALLPSMKLFSIPIIAMVGDRDTTLARQADIVLVVPVKERACPIGLTPMTSTTAMLALGDALAAVLMEIRNFRPEDYAVFHPKGSLGRRLLTRVRDIMIAGDQLPLVKPEFTMRTVLDVLISSNLGMAIAVDQENRLEGVLSDGDIKRLLYMKGDFFCRRMEDVMTRDPICTAPDTLAEEALRSMEYNKRRQITVMPVVESDDRVVGLIRMHDILQAKIR